MPVLIASSMPLKARRSYCNPRIMPASNVKPVPSRLIFLCACSLLFVVAGEAFHTSKGILLSDQYIAGIANLLFILSSSHAASL